MELLDVLFGIGLGMILSGIIIGAFVKWGNRGD